MAIVIEAPKRFFNKKLTSLFLAGGITNCPQWQNDLIKYLKDIDDLVIYNPRRKNFSIHDSGAAEEQITWEYDYLKKCDIISFWFSKGSLNPIVLYELGMYGNSDNRIIFIGMDTEYERKRDVIVQTELARPDVKIVYSLKDLADQIKNRLFIDDFELNVPIGFTQISE